MRYVVYGFTNRVRLDVGSQSASVCNSPNPYVAVLRHIRKRSTHKVRPELTYIAYEQKDFKQVAQYSRTQKGRLHCVRRWK